MENTKIGFIILAALIVGVFALHFDKQSALEREFGSLNRELFQLSKKVNMLHSDDNLNIPSKTLTLEEWIKQGYIEPRAYGRKGELVTIEGYGLY